jgi:hypothetical protein
MGAGCVNQPARKPKAGSRGYAHLSATSRHQKNISESTNTTSGTAIFKVCAHVYGSKSLADEYDAIIMNGLRYENPNYHL